MSYGDEQEMWAIPVAAPRRPGADDRELVRFAVPANVVRHLRNHGGTSRPIYMLCQGHHRDDWHESGYWMTLQREPTFGYIVIAFHQQPGLEEPWPGIRGDGRMGSLNYSWTCAQCGVKRVRSEFNLLRDALLAVDDLRRYERGFATRVRYDARATREQ